MIIFNITKYSIPFIFTRISLKPVRRLFPFRSSCKLIKFTECIDFFIGTNDKVNGNEVMMMDARSRSAVSFMLVLLVLGWLVVVVPRVSLS